LPAQRFFGARASGGQCVAGNAWRRAHGRAVHRAAATRERVVVSTDVLTLTFDSEGGTLVHSAFSKYKAGPRRTKILCCWTKAPIASMWPKPA
jgi:hypothetical protein